MIINKVNHGNTCLWLRKCFEEEIIKVLRLTHELNSAQRRNNQFNPIQFLLPCRNSSRLL